MMSQRDKDEVFLGGRPRPELLCEASDTFLKKSNRDMLAAVATRE